MDRVVCELCKKKTVLQGIPYISYVLVAKEMCLHSFMPYEHLTPNRLYYSPWQQPVTSKQQRLTYSGHFKPLMPHWLHGREI